MKSLREQISDLPKKILIGEHDKKKIYLSAPSWDCDWYWGFGYLGNKNCHYHVDGLKKIEKYNSEKSSWEYKFVNLYDGFREHFGFSLKITDNNLWTICELFQTFYTLKETAKVLGKGGSHYTNNPCKDIIINKEEVNRINEVVLPNIFLEIYKILNK